MLRTEAGPTYPTPKLCAATGAGGFECAEGPGAAAGGAWNGSVARATGAGGAVDRGAGELVAAVPAR